MLRTFGSLRALLFLGHQPTALSVDLEVLAADPRFVITPVRYYFKDWQMDALTGRDYWARADEFIAKRQSGEIDSEL
jgi:hypothetical protein